jgi:hypothetical protein
MKTHLSSPQPEAANFFPVSRSFSCNKLKINLLDFNPSLRKPEATGNFPAIPEEILPFDHGT